MPITRRYGAAIIPQLARHAGEAQAEVRGMQMDQQLANQAIQRSQESQRMRLQQQLEQAKLQQRARAMEQRERAGTMPNRARVIYPNRTARTGTSPLQQQVQRAAETFRQRQEQQAEQEQRSPYDTGEEQTAVLQGPEQTFRTEGDEIVVEERGDVVDRAPSPAGQQLTRRGQSKMAALRSVSAENLLEPSQLESLQQMAADDEIDLQEFRQWLNQSIRVAETQRQEATVEKGGLHPAQQAQMQAHSIRREADRQLRTAKQLAEPFQPADLNLSVEDFAEKARKNAVEVDRSWWPGSVGETGVTQEQAEQRAENLIERFRRYKDAQQKADELRQEYRRMIGLAEGGEDVELPQGNGESLTREQARKFLQAAGGNRERARELAREHGFQF